MTKTIVLSTTEKGGGVAGRGWGGDEPHEIWLKLTVLLQRNVDGRRSPGPGHILRS